MKTIIIISTIFFASCIKIETDGVARETGSLIRDGVKGGIELYKESKKDTTNKHDTTSTFKTLKNGTVSTYKKMKNKLKK